MELFFSFGTASSERVVKGVKWKPGIVYFLPGKWNSMHWDLLAKNQQTTRIGMRFEQGSHQDYEICAFGQRNLVKILAEKWEEDPPFSSTLFLVSDEESKKPLNYGMNFGIHVHRV